MSEGGSGVDEWSVDHGDNIWDKRWEQKMKKRDPLLRSGTVLGCKIAFGIHRLYFSSCNCGISSTRLVAEQHHDPRLVAIVDSANS